MGIFFRDNFEIDLSKWIIVEGDWFLRDGKLVCNGGADPVSRTEIVANVEPGEDYDVSFQVTITGLMDPTRGGPEGHALVRYIDADNYYFAGPGCYGWIGGIGIFLNGLASMIAGDTEPDTTYSTVEINRLYEVTIKVRAYKIDVYVDGVLVGSGVDTTHPAGRVGLTTIWSTVEFDNFIVSTPVSPLGRVLGALGTIFSTIGFIGMIWHSSKRRG